MRPCWAAIAVQVTVSLSLYVRATLALVGVLNRYSALHEASFVSEIIQHTHMVLPRLTAAKCPHVVLHHG
jgi:hypothetical protein